MLQKAPHFNAIFVQFCTEIKTKGKLGSGGTSFYEELQIQPQTRAFLHIIGNFLFYKSMKQFLLHCKKRFGVFPSPAGMSLTKLSLDGNNLIIPVQKEFG
jgi:hypothetical protein